VIINNNIFKLLFNSFLLLLTIASQSVLAQRTVKQTIVDKNNMPITDVVVYLSKLTDTTEIIGHTVSDNMGVFTFNVPIGQWQLKYSSLGYKTSVVTLEIEDKSSDTLTLATKILEDDNILLKTLIVQANRYNSKIDHLSILFSPAQISKSKTARDLMLNVPFLIVNKISNTLSSLDGKNVLILINGVKASDQDLLIIPPQKIIKADYYDVPPAKYTDSKRVLNITTGNLDSGISGNIYLNVTAFFSEFTPYFSYIHGHSQFTLGYNFHLNRVLSGIQDSYQDCYSYDLKSDKYMYTLFQEEKNWGTQNAVYAGYTNSIKNSHVFQVKINLSYATDNYDDKRNISTSVNSTMESFYGFRNSHINSMSPKVDIYYSKNINRKTVLSVNLVSTLYHNTQKIISGESSMTVFNDSLNLHNEKKSIIGEVICEHNGNANLSYSIGYKANVAWMDYNVSNSIKNDNKTQYINQTHSLFAEIKGAVYGFNYRISLNDNFIWNKNDSNKERQNIFSPTILIGRKISQSLQIRLKYTSKPINPSSSQISNNTIYLMSNMVSTGNTKLRSAKENYLSFIADYEDTYFNLGMNVFVNKAKRSIFSNFLIDSINNKPVIVMRPENAVLDNEFGVEGDFSLHPLESLNIIYSIKSIYHSFKPNQTAKAYNKWYFPMCLSINYTFKSFTFSYYQKFKSNYLENIYVLGVEKVAYFTLDYTYKNFDFGIAYYFPFGKDNYYNKTTPQSAIIHNTDARLKSKERTIGFTFSWNFHRGSKYNINRKLNNSDDDAGTYGNVH
jgi:hypothetical protein